MFFSLIFGALNYRVLSPHHVLRFSYYNATIDSISDDLTTCTVSFEKYGNTEIVKVQYNNNNNNNNNNNIIIIIIIIIIINN